MKKKTMPVALLLLIAVFFGGVIAHAQPPREPAPRAKWKKNWKSPVRSYFILKRYRENLNITDDQLDKLKEISFSLEEKLLGLKEKNGKLFLEMKKLLDSETPDYAAIEENIKKRAANRAVYIVESLKARDKTKTVLTDDQLKKINAFKNARLMSKRRMVR
ncbi:MAG: hypothetical protein JRG97_13460 [Deltaproteobacteria bacterium]|nr:hypothetical protein [Deltaproteobacteria bacterium]MBW2050741.1 hypothetical protein [Deltaproteobacteria bacterium]MBW2142053.1 hypothetical protein [Deltaproteobacteria bacterium]MBW2324619.1 hypothetical protein [Deltaproteobacteria bacterium]